MTTDPPLQRSSAISEEPSRKNVVQYNTERNVSCSGIHDVYTMKDLYTMFYNEHELLFNNPSDISTTFYLSFLAYNPLFIQQGLFSDENIIVNTFKHKRGTPYVLLIRNNNRCLISIRGTHILKDLTGVLIRQKESLQIPTILQHELLGMKNLHATIHSGFLNHALEVLAMLRNALPNKTTNPSIFVYGHSLGAGCAIIVSFLLQRIGYTNVSCSCLSCPPVFLDGCEFLTKKLACKHYHTQGDIIVEKSDIFGRFKGFRGKDYVLYGKGDTTINVKLPLQYSLNETLLSPHSIFFADSTLLGKRITFVEHQYHLIRICDKHLKHVNEQTNMEFTYNKIFFEKADESFGGGNKHTTMVNGKRYKLYKGSRGGHYIIRHGKKLYIRTS